MGTRLEMQAALAALQVDVSVYFQPPSNVSMVYPAIVYNRDIRAVNYADNGIHSQTHRYQVTVIDRDPDSLLPDLVGDLPFSTRVRHFTTEGLHHDIFYVYF
jgi:predicted membrane-bound spermidine synthase